MVIIIAMHTMTICFERWHLQLSKTNSFNHLILSILNGRKSGPLTDDLFFFQKHIITMVSGKEYSNEDFILDAFSKDITKIDNLKVGKYYAKGIVGY